MTKQLTYDEAGIEFGVHPYHVRRIIKRYPKLIQPIVLGYNRIRFDFDQVQKVKEARARDGVKAIKNVKNLLAGRMAARTNGAGPAASPLLGRRASSHNPNPKRKAKRESHRATGSLA